jgi:hypothetical protein
MVSKCQLRLKGSTCPMGDHLELAYIEKRFWVCTCSGSWKWNYVLIGYVSWHLCYNWPRRKRKKNLNVMVLFIVQL